MTDILQMAITLIIGILSSGCIWTAIQKKLEKKDYRTKLLLGLCHDRIFSLGTAYINRGWVTKEELSNLCDSLGKPYTQMGGNSVAGEILRQVKTLPIKRIQDLTPQERGGQNANNPST